MKVVISTLNSQYIHSSLAPWCLLAGIKEYSKENIEAKVVEGTVNEKIETAAERIIKETPALIGFSCYIWNITQTIELINIIKEKLKNVVIVVGGPEVSYRANDVLLKYENIDYVLSGEGEKPFALLCDAILRSDDVSFISSLSYRKNGSVIEGEPYITREDPPSPYGEEYFKAVNGRISYIETSRGCPFSCAFCLSGMCGTMRSFNLEEAKENIIKVANSGTKTVKFVDRTFNADKKRAKEIVSFIIEEYGRKLPSDVCFHFEIAGDLLDEDFLNLLRKVPLGAVQLEIGLQSFNEKTLEAIHRKTNIKKLCDNIKALVEMGNIHIHIDLIAGLPYENLESFKESFNKAFELSANMLQFGFLKMLYGAEMREKIENFPCEFSDEPPYEVISTPYLSKEELLKMHEAENALDRIYNSGRFSKTVKYIMKTMKFTAYEFFAFLGEKLSKNSEKVKDLDSFTDFFFETFKNLCDDKILRDVMILDRISTNSSGIIPKSLRVFDNDLKKIKILLDENEETRQKKGIKRCIAILYSLEKIVYVDYINQNPVTKSYSVNELPISFLKKDT